ncbi:MAG: adenylate/guanylate cyclase domain-containing protein [Lentisphaeraceae bacterium]|nr:adenylate/guanylate cyclase domain-containing protein [Lentisphaeraceae bacterium]
MNKKGRISIIIGLIAALFAILPSNFEWFKNIESSTWDWRVSSLADPRKASDEVCLILLDQKSLDWAQQENGISWPWPRELFKVILDFCSASGAKAVGYDVLFTEQSFAGHQDDLSFAESIKANERFVLAFRANSSSAKTDKWPPTYDKLFTDIQLGSELKVPDFKNIDFPVKEISDEAKLLAHVNSKPDVDGVNRSNVLFVSVGGKTVPSLGLATYLAGNDGTKVSSEGKKVKVGEKTIPVDSFGSTLLRFRGPSKTHKAYSAAEIIQSYLRIQDGDEPAVPLSALKDKYVLFGFSAPGLHDQHNVPVGGKYPGVEVHVTMIDNLLQGDFFTFAPSYLDKIIALLLAIGGAFLIVRNNNYKLQAFYVCFMVVLPIAFAFASASQGYRVSMLLPGTAVMFSLFISIAFNYMTEGRQKKFIKYAFRHYLSPHVIDELIDNPDKLKLGGVRSEISIFFSDLEGFTTISERLEPEVLIEVLNEYLSAMSDIILESNGTIDKYEGDAIIAFWNAPLPVENHAAQIVRSALKCQAVLAEMNPQLKGRAGADLKMRIGIHTGPAVVGNMGASERFDYTMLGDAVNLAARLEGVNKQFGTYTLISIDTKNQMGDAFPIRELAKVEVVGRKEPVRVFEPMEQKEYDANKEYIDKFLVGLDLFYHEKFAEALEVFKENQDNDPPSKKYVKKCQDILDSGLSAPEGVWVMTSK